MAETGTRGFIGSVSRFEVLPMDGLVMVVFMGVVTAPQESAPHVKGE